MTRLEDTFSLEPQRGLTLAGSNVPFGVFDVGGTPHHFGPAGISHIPT